MQPILQIHKRPDKNINLKIQEEIPRDQIKI